MTTKQYQCLRDGCKNMFSRLRATKQFCSPKCRVLASRNRSDSVTENEAGSRSHPFRSVVSETVTLTDVENQVRQMAFCENCGGLTGQWYIDRFTPVFHVECPEEVEQPVRCTPWLKGW